MRNFDLSPLYRSAIGFDKLANALQNAGGACISCRTTLRKATITTTALFFALAGFRQEVI